MDKDLWPYNPDSRKADRNIDWATAHPKTITLAQPEILSQVSREDAKALLGRPQAQFLTDSNKELLRAIVEQREYKLSGAQKQKNVKERITEDMILETMEAALEKAKAVDDQAMVFKFSESLAKYKSMFNRDDEKGDVVINVVTGVPESEHLKEK